MVSSKLKEKFEGWVAGGVRPLASLGVTPNTLTVMGLVASTLSALCYIGWRTNRLLLPAAGALILLSGLIDALDGVLARTTGSVSAFGGFFDSVSDRYSDAVVLSAILYAGLCHPAWGLAAIVGSLMVSYTRARAEATGVKMAAVGLAERAERMVFLALISVAAYYNLQILYWGVVVLAVVAQFTVLQRAAHFYKESGKL
ncbi:CDP-alcohol phosphatidyltransferase family protein [Candidatus Bathyarchaeota archaeon]|nr:CDP-alcohol phosphatidyltransferase family protein [Candidatus Bathyarchaeota archaeon]